MIVNSGLTYIVGPTILTQQDIIEQRFHYDAVSYGGWSIDLHPADGVFSKTPGCTQWHSKGVYHIPFSTMVCRDVPNLMYGGRIISASHVAFGSSRVMATCGNNGNALGIAASLCKGLQLLPVDLLDAKKMKLFQIQLMRSGQFIPGFKLKDPEDLIRSASKLEASGEFDIDNLPADGPPKVLKRSLAQMLPLKRGIVPTFELEVQATEPTTLTVQLRGSEKAHNYTPEVILSSKMYYLSIGSNSLHIDFNVTNPQEQYIFLCLLKNESVFVSTTETRISGILTVEHECTQEPPSGIGIDRFERWTPVRRPMGHNLALKVSPPIKAFGIDNLRNGLARPTKRPNCWLVNTKRDKNLLRVEWERPQVIGRIVVCFDTDFDNGESCCKFV